MKQRVRLTESDLHRMIRESVRQVLRESTANLEGQYKIVGSNSDFDIIVCNTFEAEQYFGSGTQWCTVADAKFFDHYMKKGPLYIIYPKNGDNSLKMQFHLEDDIYTNAYDETFNSADECIENTIDDERMKSDLMSLCQRVLSTNFTSFSNESLNRQRVRLTESDLHRMIREAVSEVLNEYGETPKSHFMLSGVEGRADARALAASLNGDNATADKYRELSKAAHAKRAQNIANDKFSYSRHAKEMAGEQGYNYGNDYDVNKRAQAREKRRAGK